MRTLQILLGTIATTALVGAGVAVAEIRHSIESPKFSVSTEDGSITLPELKFCDVGEEAEPCVMTPSGTAPSMLMELPVVPPAVLAQTARYTSAQAAIAPISSLPSSTSYNEPRPRRTRTPTTTSTVPIVPAPPDDPPQIEVTIPEPATLVVVGLGIGGAVAARRWRKE